jgi:CRISPR-associated protein Csm1
MKAGLLRAGEWIAPSPNRRVIYVLNDGGKSNASIDVKTAIGRRYLTNVTPSVTEADIAAARKAKLKDLPKVDRVKPFDLMEMQAVGIKRLGVLMMDVDGLGAIFRDGLAERATLPRIAHLSFAINLFFEGYVAEIARTIDLETERGERLYSVYAGGDDLFFVGAWDAVIEMAQRVRAALDDYTGHHPGLHASGAIVLTGGKYPLYRAAQDLKEAEHVAKTLEWKSSDGKLRRKDALCFLGQALPWFRVGYGDVQPDGNTAAGIKELLLSVQKVSDKGLVRKLAELYTSYAEANEQRQRDGLPKQQYGPWHYRAAYTFARAARQAGASHRADVENAGEAIMADGFKGIEWVGLGARWSELASRNEVDA